MEQSGDLNRRSYDTGGLWGVFKRTVRIIPAFVAAGTVSCAVGHYGFHIAPERLGIIAGVPCVVGFIVIRILALILPSQSTVELEQSRPSTFFRIIVILAVLAAWAAIDFLFSASLYYSFGESRLAVLGALKIALFGAALAMGFIFIAFVTKFPELWVNVFASAVKVLRTQTELSRAFLPSPIHKHWSR